MSEVIDLDSCAREPIHIPGAIQPHGALVALRDGAVTWFSANLEGLTGLKPKIGCLARDLDGPTCWLDGLQDALADMPEGQPFTDVVASPDGTSWTRAGHWMNGLIVVEFEPALTLTRDPYVTSRAFNKIRTQKSVLSVLSTCCADIRAWTGFDRVLGYVFQPDGSGDVVAESRAERAPSFLGMRFPASDIPAQARALYIRNTLRFIADVGYVPVPLLGEASAGPLDLSGSTLRSVSPIHIEYLKNMGVGASMSVSIVLNGQLWGMFACHHQEPLQVPLAVRESCDMLANFVVSRLQTLLAEELAERHRDAAALTSRLGAEFVQSDDPVKYLFQVEQTLRTTLRADGLVITHRGKVLATGGVPQELAVQLSQHFAQPGHLAVAVTCRDEWPTPLRDVIGPWVGMLPIDFDPALGGRVLAMRKEQIEAVRWAGEPAKTYGEGPNGPRLTPRGSFNEWLETVEGVARPWLPVTLEIANTIRTELTRAVAAVHQDAEEARHHLLAILGHDLRDPLHAIRMSATMLQRHEASKQLGDRIDRSSGRMQRLITQVLDFSRAESGQSLLGDLVETDIGSLVRDLIDESHHSHPGTNIDFDLPSGVMRVIDASRLSQALGNLLSNARHHTEIGAPISVKMDASGDGLIFTVSNKAPPIDSELVPTLFDPLKRVGRAATNRSGLGLGLYIAKRIALAMGGDLNYSHRDGRVEFCLSVRTC